MTTIFLSDLTLLSSFRDSIFILNINAHKTYYLIIMDKKYNCKSTFFAMMLRNVFMISSTFTFIFLGSRSHGQSTINRYPLTQTSVSSTTEKQKTEFLMINSTNEYQIAEKIVYLDNEIRQQLDHGGYEAEMVNKYFEKVNTDCVGCISLNGLDPKATYLFVETNPVASENLLLFLQEFYNSIHL
jgi:hypothetical protein